MKILVVSALPFDVSSSTRAFRTYFHSFDKDQIAQIYTNSSLPDYSYCNRFYQITDARVLKGHFNKKLDPGIVFSADDTPVQMPEKTKHRSLALLKKDWGILHLIRSCIWKEKYWFTSNLKKWIEVFRPDCVFYHNSNSLFISKLALRIAEYYHLPLVAEVSDDYYYARNESALLFSRIYSKQYRRFFESMMAKVDGCIYVSEKMKEHYAAFHVSNSDYVSISSEISRDEISKHVTKGSFCYFGNTGFHRDRTLRLLGERLSSLREGFHIDVYSPLKGNSGFRRKNEYPGIRLCGFLPYDELIKTVSTYEYIVIAEPLNEKTGRMIGLSLSTKVADSLLLGKKIICVGNSECGTVEYVDAHRCGMVLKTKEDVRSLSWETIESFDWTKCADRCEKTYESDFSLESNSQKAVAIFNNALLRRGGAYER